MDRIKNKPLDTERLRLHYISPNDYEEMAKILFDDKIKRTYMLKDFESVEEAKEFHEKLCGLSNSTQFLFYGIFYKDKLIGFINEVEENEDSIELGYVIATYHQRKGYCPEALRAVINELFRIGYKEVYCGYFKGNTPSKKVMIKVGMKPLKKKEIVNYRDRKHTCLFYNITK